MKKREQGRIVGRLIQGVDGVWRPENEIRETIRKTLRTERRAARQAWLDAHPQEALEIAMLEMTRFIENHIRRTS